MLEAILLPLFLDTVTPQFDSSSSDVALLLTCSEAAQVIENINQRASVEVKEDLIETIKLNTEPECYEGSERNS